MLTASRSCVTRRSPRSGACPWRSISMQNWCNEQLDSPHLQLETCCRHGTVLRVQPHWHVVCAWERSIAVLL